MNLMILQTMANDVPANENVVVSFIIVVRNGASVLPALLDDFLAQDFPVEKMELLLVEGGSTDDTRSVIEDFIHRNSHIDVKVLNNSDKILSSGWNIALAHARGAIILRVDAHARIPFDFINNNVKRISSGESICGGYLEAVKPDKFWKKLLYYADASRFGGSVASFRNPGTTRYVDTVAYAAYLRGIFARVGGYDERLVRNQDNEMHYRMRKAGFKFFFDTEIHSFYRGRRSLAGLLKQKFCNGLWIGKTLGISPRCFRLRHLVPALFVVGMLATMLFLLYFTNHVWSWFPAFFLIAMYFCLAVYFSYTPLKNEKSWAKLVIVLLPFVFFLMHTAYGLGTIVGIIEMPFFLWHTRRYSIPRPVLE